MFIAYINVLRTNLINVFNLILNDRKMNNLQAFHISSILLLFINDGMTIRNGRIIGLLSFIYAAQLIHHMLLCHTTNIEYFCYFLLPNFVDDFT